MGRTGAGKSSMVLALFRLVEYERMPPPGCAGGEAIANEELSSSIAAVPVATSTVTECSPVCLCVWSLAVGDLISGIRIDGKWIHDVPLQELRASLCVIPQDPTLFRCARVLAPGHVFVA